MALRRDDDEALEFVKRYFRALETGTTGDTLAKFFTDDVIQEELPNRLVPSGARRGLAEILDGAEKGQRAVRAQSYRILNSVVAGESLALEVEWLGTLAVPLGTIPAGGQMRARFAVFLEMRNGKIARQRNYDCFDPF